MKNLQLYIFILFLGLSSFAQPKPSLKNANHLFVNRSYVDAAKMYETLKPSQEVLQNLGDCYYYNSQMDFAVKNYGQLFFSFKDSLKSESYFKYANALKGANDYEKADVIMSEYLKYQVNTKKFIENLDNIVPYDYEIQLMAKSISNGDFGMSFFGDKVVFASLRSTDKPIFNWNQKPYLDLYEATISKDGLLENIKPFSDKINTKTHESDATFSADGKTMYFSRTNSKRVKIGEEKVATVKIFKAEFVNNEWTNVIEMPFSNDMYSTEHPFLTKDGKKLYFASDMPGTLGSMDLYSVDINSDGTYTTPKNLGDVINTIHREQFPFLTEDGTLYFASDGHEGLGGLDIFMSKMYNDVFVKPLNLGKTINSNLDDFGYVLDEKANKGYLSSNRKGSDNLYSFIRKENERRFLVEGDVKDKTTKDLLPGTTVTLYDEDNKLVGQMVVGSKAEYFFNTRPNKKYRVEAIRDFYIPSNVEFTTNDEGKARFTIELQVESYDDAEDIVVTKNDGYVYIELENIYFDLNKWNIKEQASKILDVLVGLLNKYPLMEVQIGAHTDSRASEMYNLILSNNRAASTLEYLVNKGIDRKRLRSKGYGESVPLVKCGDKCTEAEHSINRRCEFRVLK
ncbi:OmpA family protein [Flavobacterium sp. SUN052]|uniref:OmpA family protein n=1 Tax=Flavobacterium sp. SUN052 TaxID=3002441 RepID=UPI00237D75D9|nr:OmpA family protein [Flavobacterium sp. SUN052]MEC4003734.1 OmpA family protein [Flavobacterium sp. SUN052]